MWFGELDPEPLVRLLSLAKMQRWWSRANTLGGKGRLASMHS